MTVPEESTTRDLVLRVIEEAQILSGSLDSGGSSDRDPLNSAIRMRLLTGEICQRLIAERKEGKPKDA